MALGECHVVRSGNRCVQHTANFSVNDPLTAYGTGRPWTRVVVLLSGGVPVKLAVDMGEADPRPYVRLAARLRKEIVTGTLTPGHPVASITMLSQEFGHARPTL